jgi:hypothetical protein
LYAILVCSEGNIVNHICQTQLGVLWCWLQYCVISTSNGMETMQLIEGSNNVDYLLILLEFHDYFPSQMI